ncbi:hypothetical protein SLEP1_g24436 [Rubroshorea leprosula]|uniref:Uncharacterized protein n=1 Tax=Rubroshorea leprosula TaxID=152421 RepID=A0AAV5JN12_9ROSI|nr:hypothetical protein SLEP1_g24436 [Rubroshorea leprosula]
MVKEKGTREGRKEQVNEFDGEAEKTYRQNSDGILFEPDLEPRNLPPVGSFRICSVLPPLSADCSCLWGVICSGFGFRRPSPICTPVLLVGFMVCDSLLRLKLSI